MEGGILIKYESRYLLILLNAVINQKPAQTVRRQVNWRTTLKISDFHNVTSLVYHGMLGMQKEVSEECEEELYQKYRRELLLRDSYKDAQEVIMWQMEKHGIQTLLLSGTDVQELYPTPEMSYIEQLEFLVDKEKMPAVDALMEEMAYERKENRLGNGKIYIRTPGIQVIFYDRIPIRNKVLNRYFSDSIKRYLKFAQYKFVHGLSMEELYIYRAGRLVELYVTGLLKIRHVLDFWQYQRSLDESFQWKIVEDLLEKAKLHEFIYQVAILSSLWFGDGGKYDYSTALELEEYILSNGRENRRLDAAILPGEMERLDFYRRDREEEWTHKKREWLFPPKEYMVLTFPVLEKHGGLLVFCWAVRSLKLFKKLGANKCKEAADGINTWFSNMKAKLKKTSKEEEEEKEEQKEEDTEPGDTL